MSCGAARAASGARGRRLAEDSTDSDDAEPPRPLLRRISTSKCVGRLPVVKEGYLMKQTRSFQRWQRRYFMLRGRTLYYAKDKEDKSSRSAVAIPPSKEPRLLETIEGPSDKIYELSSRGPMLLNQSQPNAEVIEPADLEVSTDGGNLPQPDEVEQYSTLPPHLLETIPDNSDGEVYDFSSRGPMPPNQSQPNAEVIEPADLEVSTDGGNLPQPDEVEQYSTLPPHLLETIPDNSDGEVYDFSSRGPMPPNQSQPNAEVIEPADLEVSTDGGNLPQPDEVEQYSTLPPHLLETIPDNSDGEVYDFSSRGPMPPSQSQPNAEVIEPADLEVSTYGGNLPQPDEVEQLEGHTSPIAGTSRAKPDDENYTGLELLEDNVYSTSELFDECELVDTIFAECSIKNINHSFQVITAHRSLVLCAESRAEMEAWAGALRGALHRGSDVTDLVATLSTGDHHWYAATHARPTFCNVCREPLGTLGTAHALACELCKFKAHKRCATRAPPSCKWTTLASLASDIIENADGSITMPHQWLEGNLPVSAKCTTCDKTCGSVLRLQDFRCVWCRRCVHAGCRPGWRSACELGAARASIVPPTHLHSVGPDDAWEADRPPGTSPLIVFVNSKSGDNQGVKFLRRFKQLLNPAQVFELGGAGCAGAPRLGLQLFRHFAPLRVLVCSGDGSVGWVLQEIDKLDMHKQTQVAVLPLGTGNDLARVLGWGASCDDAANLTLLLERYERASTKMLDRWSIMTFERPLAIAHIPPPPPAPPDRASTDEATLLRHLQYIIQAENVEAASEAAAQLVGGAALLSAAAAGERGAARAALRLRRAVALLLRARQLDDHPTRIAQGWELTDTSEESEPEAEARAARGDTDGEKGSKEKTEKEQLNSAARGAAGAGAVAAGAEGCALAARADSVRRALRNLLKRLQPATDSTESVEGAAAGGGGDAVAGSGGAGALPVPRAFADGSRRSSAASNDAAVLHPDNIPDVDEDIAKLISSNPPDRLYNLEVEKKLTKLASEASAGPGAGGDKLSLYTLSPCDTGSCRNLSSRAPDHDDPCSSSTLTIPNLVISDSSNDKQDTALGQKYESEQMTIIDTDKPYTDDVHFHDIARASATTSADNSPERKRRSEPHDSDERDSDGSNISDDFSLVSELMEGVDKPDADETPNIGHIDSPEASDATYVNSETLHGESIIDDISSMLGQDVLLAMLGKNGDNETYTDDTTLFTSDTVSDIALDSRNPSLERYDESKMKFLKKMKKATKEPEAEKFGFENRVFNLENSVKSDEHHKYCSLAQFVEGNDIARQSFKKHMRRSKRLDRKVTTTKTAQNVMDDNVPELRLPEMNIPSTHNSPKVQKSNAQEIKSKLQLYPNELTESQLFPQVSVVVEPPSPAHSDEAKGLKTSNTSRMANVLNDFFDKNTDSLSVKSSEGVGNNGVLNRERRSSDNPNLLNSDPEYNRFLSCSPAATRRISCGSLFKHGEADKLSTSISSVWGDSTVGLGNASTGSRSNEKVKRLPIINPLVLLPAWPHVTGGLISQCLLANADALCAAVSPLMDPDETLLEGFDERAVMNNYFGIGIDAKITLDFHNKREEHPEKCRSRARNYMWYGVLGSKEWVNRTYRHLGQRVQLECDGQRIPLPELQGIVVLNIPSFMGGTNFWGGTRADDLFLAPSFDDRVLEVVAVFGSAQMAASRLLNLQKHRIAQCRAVQINILGDECVPVQVDGEAWLQPPGCIRIIHKNRAQMLARSRALETSLRAWDEKQQMKQSAISAGPSAAEASRDRLTPAETAQLLAFMDATNTLVKWVKLSCISEGGSAGGGGGGGGAAGAVSLARRVAANMDSLQDADGRLLPGTQLRLNITTMVHSCQELVEAVGSGGGSGASSGAGAAAVTSVRAHLARCELHDGLTYLHAEEVPKKHSVGGGKVSWLRPRKSISETAVTGPTASQVKAWGVTEVRDWLVGLQLAEYADSFTRNDITGRELLALARRDLKDLGVTKVGHIKRILQAIKEML